MFTARAACGCEDELEDEQRLMSEPSGKRLQPGLKLAYEYDFGSTTNLSLRVPDERPGSLPKPPIRLLPRNEPPDIRCTRCRKPTPQICAEGEVAGDDGAHGDACATKLECGEEMLLSVLNPPRVGVGGYTGPSVEP